MAASCWYLGVTLSVLVSHLAVVSPALSYFEATEAAGDPVRDPQHFAAELYDPKRHDPYTHVSFAETSGDDMGEEGSGRQRSWKQRLAGIFGRKRQPSRTLPKPQNFLRRLSPSLRRRARASSRRSSLPAALEGSEEALEQPPTDAATQGSGALSAAASETEGPPPLPPKKVPYAANRKAEMFIQAIRFDAEQLRDYSDAIALMVEEGHARVIRSNQRALTESERSQIQTDSERIADFIRWSREKAEAMITYLAEEMHNANQLVLYNAVSPELLPALSATITFGHETISRVQQQLLVQRHTGLYT